MHVISRKKLLEAGEAHKEIALSLDAWFRVANSASCKWGSLEDVRKTYSSVDGVRAKRRVYTVFNIGGNKFRLITEIYYDKQTILVRDVLTHSEYDNGDWKK